MSILKPIHQKFIYDLVISIYPVNVLSGVKDRAFSVLKQASLLGHDEAVDQQGLLEDSLLATCLLASTAAIDRLVRRYNKDNLLGEMSLVQVTDYLCKRGTMIKSITLQLDAAVADAFNQASLSQQQAMQTIVSLWLKHMVKPDSLEAITQEIHQEAASNGLTAAVLDDLLGDD